VSESGSEVFDGDNREAMTTHGLVFPQHRSEWVGRRALHRLVYLTATNGQKKPGSGRRAGRGKTNMLVPRGNYDDEWCSTWSLPAIHTASGRWSI
jgi:hypothetical protein